MSIISILILSSHPSLGCSKLSHLCRFSDPNIMYTFLIPHMHATWLHLTLLHLVTVTILREKQTFIYHLRLPLNSTFSGGNILLSTSFPHSFNCLSFSYELINLKYSELKHEDGSAGHKIPISYLCVRVKSGAGTLPYLQLNEFNQLQSLYSSSYLQMLSFSITPLFRKWSLSLCCF